MKIINLSFLFLVFSFLSCTSEEDPQLFSLTVNNGSGGGTFSAGEVVNIQANAPAENQLFQQWTGDIETLENASSASTTIIMPSKNVIINATYNTFDAQDIVNVSVNFSTEFQTMEGFGFFGARDVWWGNPNAGHFHSDEWLEMVIGDLGLSMWRNEVYPHLPVTSNTTPNQDAHWDKQRPMVQALKAKADQYDVDLRIILTAWTPPGSFKWNAWGYTWPGDQNAQRGPGPEGDFWPERGVSNPGQSPSHNSGTLNPNKYNEFAQWWIDAIQMYKDIGINVYAISPQNEPAFNQPYNSSFYTTHWYAEMINGVIPQIKAAHPEVLIFGSEHMLQNEGREIDFPFFYHNRLKQDATAMTHIDALAVHGYLDGVNVSSGTDLAQYWINHKREFGSYPGTRSWMTETSGYEDTWEPANSRPGAMGMAVDIATAITFGNVSAWVHWQGSQLDGIDRFSLMSDRTVGKKYQASKHFYHFIRPGAIRIEATSPNEEVTVLGFHHAVHDTKTFVLINTKTEEVAVRLNFEEELEEEFEMYVSSVNLNCASQGAIPSDGLYLLPARSIVTLHAGGSQLMKD